jgi:hypothetical protein
VSSAVAWAIRNRGYTDKTHLRGFENLDFSLFPFTRCLKILAWTIGNRGYTNKIYLREFENFDFR